MQYVYTFSLSNNIFLNRCDFTGAIFAKMNLQNIYFERSNLEEVQFTESNLTNASFCASKIKNIRFSDITAKHLILSETYIEVQAIIFNLNHTAPDMKKPRENLFWNVIDTIVTMKPGYKTKTYQLITEQEKENLVTSKIITHQEAKKLFGFIDETKRPNYNPKE